MIAVLRAGQPVHSKYFRTIESGAPIEGSGALYLELRQASGAPLDLTGRSVLVVVRRKYDGADAWTGAAMIVNAALGRCSVEIPEGQLIQESETSHEMDYGLFVIVDHLSETEEWVPGEGYDLNIRVIGKDQRSLDVAKGEAAKAQVAAGEARTSATEAEQALQSLQSKITTGTTAERPFSPSVGHMHFDTTLGKPVWWKGPTWVDATGGFA